MTSTDPLPAAKRRIIDALKRQALTGPELAASFGVSPEAIRQHLAELAANGLVRSRPRASSGAGRPPAEWSLTDLAADLFPDRHADLTVSLIGSLRTTLGEDGLDKVIAARTAEQLAEYRGRLAGAEDRLAALADLRSEEGYLAEVAPCPAGDGWLLTEHHCPICDAAQVCQGLCRSELELFQEALGDAVTVSREQHLLAGDERCVYRIRPSSG